MFSEQKQRRIVEDILVDVNAGRLETARRKTMLSAFTLKPETREYVLSVIENKKKRVHPTVLDAVEKLGGTIVYD